MVTQLESSDAVVINKMDLVDEAELGPIEELIKRLSPNARQLKATLGGLPLRELLPADPLALDMPAYVPTLVVRHAVAVSSARAAERAREMTAPCSASLSRPDFKSRMLAATIS